MMNENLLQGEQEFRHSNDTQLLNHGQPRRPAYQVGDLLTRAEAVAYLKISLSTLHRMIRLGVLKAVKANGRTLIPYKNILESLTPINY